MKNFRTEIETLFNRLTTKEPFSFSKYADGEWAAMHGVNLFNGEFRCEDTEAYNHSRKLLIDSFQYQHENYYVGVSCPCCQGNAHYEMKQFSGQNEEHLTFANIFVNENYSYYTEKFIPEYSNWTVNLVANEKSDISKLPFAVKNFYPVGINAWVNNLDLIETIKKNSAENELYLFCCGPFGNILAHQLWDHNKNNTYLDIGSTLNPYLGFEGFRRGYLYGGADLHKVCIWG